MNESDKDLRRLDDILAVSFGRAGSHLAGIISETRRLSAADLSTYLVGVKHWVVSTVTETGEPRCSAVDGLFIAGRFWCSTSADSFKIRDWQRRPALSAAHVVGDDVGIFLHGTTRIVRGATPEAAELAEHWRAVYGGTPEEWVDEPSHARYVEMVPHRLFTYAFNRSRFEAMLNPGT
jgi:hypothetical protein